MNILIPMAGAGQRFVDAGYKTHKPTIMTIDRKSGKEFPMVVCATMDLPWVEEEGKNITYIDRKFHKEDGVETLIKKYYPKANFITIDYLTEGQASTCLLAKDIINNQQELLIAGCDNGMVIKEEEFKHLKTKSDAIVFTFTGNSVVSEKPEAYGWMRINKDRKIIGTSIKTPISNNPLQDHAVVATFWFKTGNIFVEAAEKMIRENDRIRNEFYVDQVIKHIIDLGYNAYIFDVEHYISWGTPKDFENYKNTFQYWEKFVKNNADLLNAE